MTRSACNNHTSNGKTVTETAHPAGSKLYKSLARNIFLVSLPLLSLALIASIETSAQYNAYATAENTDVVDEVNINVPSSCTITAVLENREYSVSVNPGSTGEVEANVITTSCNDPSGYSLYAIGFTGDTETGNNHTKMVGSNTGETISTGTNTGSGSSSWAMKLTSIANAEIMNSYGSYQVVPNTWTQVARYTSATTTSTVKPWYRIFVDSSQPADAYTGQIKYAIVHPNTYVAGTYTIAYNANGGTGTMTSSTNLYNFEPFTLPASTLTAPTGYAFAGWCTTNTSQYSCTDGTLYQPGDEVTSLATAGGTANLYAVWDQQVIMQSATSADCGQEMVDTRDGNTYTTATIGSLCWMTQNLRFTDTSVPAATSNVTADKTLTYYSLDSNDSSYSGNCDGSNGYSKACIKDSDSTSTGVWYNYYAATAGTISGSSNSTAASQDICPKNWHLPTNSEFTGITSYVSAFLPVAGGVYGGGSLSETESANWWSATANGTTYRYSRYWDGPDGSSLNTGRYSLRHYGYYVRCVRSS